MEDPVLESLRRRIAALSRGRLHPREVDADAHLFDRGYLDSLSYVEFLLHVEADWAVKVPDAQLIGRFNTLRALAAHIAVRAGEPR
jgi:acyl carrier protein